ncbi:MAG TPA: thymidine phosphorylase [Candidatus Sulfotelmatobacter sp.]|jgi:putative thymidine phosphorylase|nr:thymidine phosphorylase [Candidatus Sulfotelmatobacter sp.]
MTEETLALQAIRKKLVGKRLSYKEIFAVMDAISHEKLSPILTTYFAASGYSKGFSNEEMYYLTKAMIETGEQLKFKGIVADKHSIGGVPGTRTTLLVIPIIAAAGFLIPKSSSRAITTPGGTGDDMEVLAPVTFSKEEIYRIVRKANACIVWGGSVDIAPADDELIKVEQPLMFESFDKILVSIMAKKIAFGSNHIVIDLPYGSHVKVHKRSDAEILAKKFEYLARKFKVTLQVCIHDTNQPAGRGVGPVLETKEALKVLEQKVERPLDLEEKALTLAGILLDLCLKDAPKRLRDQVKKEFGNGENWAKYILSSGHALKKMREIIDAQGGNSAIISEDLKPGKYAYSIKAKEDGIVKEINSSNVTIIAKILGAPIQKKSGIYLHKKSDESVKSGDTIFTLYSESQRNLEEAKDSLANFPMLSYR